MTAEKLAAEWLTAKKAELEAINRRVQIENDILKLYPPREEGSTTTVLTNGVRVKATGKLTYKADIDRLLQLTASWPDKPIKTKVEADESLLKAIRTDRPDLWRQIAPAITVKPAKTYIVIEEPAHGL